MTNENAKLLEKGSVDKKSVSLTDYNLRGRAKRGSIIAQFTSNESFTVAKAISV